MGYYLESDLRRWLRTNQSSGLFWMEPAAGSTVGMPDAVFLKPGFSFWLELKIGHERKEDWLSFTVRKSQKMVLRELCKAGQKAFFIVMEDFRQGRIWAVAASEAVCEAGCVNLETDEALLIGNLKGAKIERDVISRNAERMLRIVFSENFARKVRVLRPVFRVEADLEALRRKTNKNNIG